MLELMRKVRMIMKMERLVEQNTHLITVKDYDNLRKERESHLDSLFNQEPSGVH
jgi:hypothetical protein